MWGLSVVSQLQTKWSQKSFRKFLHYLGYKFDEQKSAILQIDMNMQKMLPVEKSLLGSILNMKKEHTGGYK